MESGDLTQPTTPSRKDVSPPAPPRLTIHHEKSKSLLTSLIHVLIRPLRPRLVRSSHKTPQPEASARLFPPKSIRKICHVHERKVDEIWLYDIRRRDETAEETKKRIFYFAGGGWQMIPGREHWYFLKELAGTLNNTTVTLVSYPLAPNCPAHRSLPMLQNLYGNLLRQSRKSGEKVIFAGDSSGGNIALSLVLWSISDAEKSQKLVLAPDELMVMSPSTDLRHNEPAILKAGKKDPVMTPAFIETTANAWIGVNGPHSKSDLWTKDDPRVSPILADLSLFLKYGIIVNGINGTWEVLGPEAMIFRDALRAAGVEGEWGEWEGQMHCFPLAATYGLRDSKKALRWIIELLNRP